jgi:hypothetical protein
MEERFCAIDDMPVKPVRAGDPELTKKFGQGLDEATGKYYHSRGNGICGKQFLEEHQTYTETDHIPDGS